MKQRLASLFALVVLGTSAHAQQQIGSYTPPSVSPRPPISPYLNLNRGGGNAAMNYFGIVRPQMENQQAIQNLQQQNQQTQGVLQTQGNPLIYEEMAPTGHRLGGFFNYGHFFPLYYQGTGGATAPGLTGTGIVGPGLAGQGVAGQGCVGFQR